MDVDSLWNVFVNYEKAKAENLHLRLQNDLRATQVKELESAVANYMMIEENLTQSVIPLLEQQKANLKKQVRLERRRGTGKFLKGAGIGIIGGVVLGLAVF